MSTPSFHGILAGVWLLLSISAAGIPTLSLTPASGHPERVSLVVLEKSYLTIRGYTNINSFTCSYCSPLTRYPDEIWLNRKDTSLVLSGASLTLPVQEFDCGIKQLTRDFRDLVCAESHPELIINFDYITLTNRSGHEGYQVACTIQLAGRQKQVRFPLTVTEEEGVLGCYGETDVDLAWFGIEPPTRMMGMVKVKDHITVQLHLFLQQDKP